MSPDLSGGGRWWLVDPQVFGQFGDGENLFVKGHNSSLILRAGRPSAARLIFHTLTLKIGLTLSETLLANSGCITSAFRVKEG